MLRAFFAALGKTAELEYKSIAEAVARLKNLLTDWRAEYTTLFGDEESGLPDPAGITLTKAAGGMVLSDNASAAVATTRFIIQHDLYDDADDDAEDWLPVDAKKYGMDGQDGWKIVPLCALEQGEEKSESNDGSASSSQGASDSDDDSESAGDESASEGESDGDAEAEPKGKKRAQPTQGGRGARGS